MDMVLVRRLFVVICLLVVGGLIWAGVYTRKHGFTQSWRSVIEEELERQGYYVDIKKLTLGAFRGLVAEDVRFFRDKEKTEQFAEINDIFLDVGLERILEKKISVNTLDIQDGRLIIPLDPEKPIESEKIQIHDISGRIALTESRVEIARMNANLGGLEFSIKGSLLLPPNQPSEVDTAGREALEATVARVRSLKKTIDALKSFDFSEGNPELKIVFRSDLRDLASTTATATLTAKKFGKRGSSYQVGSLDVATEFDGRIMQVKIPKFQLRDQSGLFDGKGIWKGEPDEFDFEISSSADIINLVEIFFPNKKWGEVVFFQSPIIKAEGKVQLMSLLKKLAADKPNSKLIGGGSPLGRFQIPGQILGDFTTERFVTSGVVFNGARGDFSVKGNRFYVRNFRADQKTGVAFLNWKYEPGKGRETIQFQSEIKMDPRVFSPFLKEESTKRFLSKFSFNDNSGVYLAAAGRCSNFDLADLQAKGVIDLRDFRLNNIPFRELESEFEVEGTKRWYRNVRMTRENGKIEAELAHVDTAARLWELKGAESKVSLGDGIGAFSPKLRELLRPYRFSSPPVIKMQGVIDARFSSDLGDESRTTDLMIDFSSDGTAYYDLFGKALPLNSPRGTIRIQGERAHLRTMKAGLCGGSLSVEFDTPDLKAESSPFDASVTVQHAELESLGRLYGFANESKGHLDGTMHFSGKTGSVASLNGHGQVSMGNADLHLIPAISALRTLLEENESTFREKAEGEGESDKSRATASFGIKSGVFTTNRLTLAPGGVSLKGKATVDLPNRIIVSANLVGKEGNTYSCEGELGKPKWTVEEKEKKEPTTRPKPSVKPPKNQLATEAQVD